MIGRALVLVALVSTLLACSDRARSSSTPSTFKSTDITGVDWGRDFHLTDHAGRPRSVKE